MTASPAAAEPIVYGDAGIFLGYAWGPGGGFHWGLEGRVVRESDDWGGCDDDPVAMTAAVARLAMTGTDGLYLGAALQGGMVTPSLPVAILGDLGLGYRFGEDGGLSLPLGITMSVYMVDTFVRLDPVLGGGAAGHGVHAPWQDRQLGCVVAGRALHDEVGHAELPAIVPLSERTHDPGLGEELGRAVAGEWSRRAQAEWASVPAFLQLADQLVRAGAPGALVHRALVAADDERRHAEASARLAVRYGGVPVGLGPVTPRTRAPLEGLDALRRLAVESWADGCLGEGRAARTAAREAARAGDRVAPISSGIAGDESRHAELAWDVLAWAIARGGDDVRQAVWSERDAAPPAMTGGAEGLPLAAYGVLDDVEHARIGDDITRDARRRLRRLLDA